MISIFEKDNNAVEVKAQGAFTLIELLVVIAIIGILSSVVLASLSNARASARDTQRVQALRNMQTALEIYYNDNGQYPDTGSSWQGGCDYGNHGYDSSGYIPGLVPEYMTRLPEDPRCGETYNWSGGASFIYKSDGEDYALLNHHGIETFDPEDTNHPLDRPGHNQQSLGVYSGQDGIDKLD